MEENENILYVGLSTVSKEREKGKLWSSGKFRKTGQLMM